jgi:tetratricopeptide (TPR) repeat protein
MALDVDQDAGDIHVDLALILYEKGDKAMALTHFEKAVKLGRLLDTKPKWYFTSLYYSGVHKQNVGDDAGALKIYEEYLSIAPLAAIDREDVEKRVEKLKSGF